MTVHSLNRKSYHASRVTRHPGSRISTSGENAELEIGKFNEQRNQRDKQLICSKILNTSLHGVSLFIKSSLHFLKVPFSRDESSPSDTDYRSLFLLLPLSNSHGQSVHIKAAMRRACHSIVSVALGNV